MATTRLSSKLLKARTHARRRGASKRPAPANGGAHDEGQAYATGSNAPTTGELQLEVSIGRRVRLLRQRLQLTATELAAEAGLSPGMLSKIENGGTSPSLSTLEGARPRAQRADDELLRRFRGAPRLLLCARRPRRVDRAARHEVGPPLRAARPFALRRHRGRALSHHPERGRRALCAVPARRRRVHLHADGKSDLPPRRQALSNVGGRRAVLRRRRAARARGAARAAHDLSLDHHLPAQLEISPQETLFHVG